MRSTRPVLYSLLALLFALALLAGCGGGDAEEAAALPAGEVAADASVAQGGSPLIVAGGSPLATPTVISPLPAPGSSGLVGVAGVDTGSIVGRILIGRDAGDVPVAGLILGLADIIRGEDGIARASGYSPDTPNRTTTDDGGGFVLNNIPPGTYSLILDAVTVSYQLADPASGDVILVEVQPGEVIDVGVLRFDSLPLPGFSE